MGPLYDSLNESVILAVENAALGDVDRRGANHQQLLLASVFAADLPQRKFSTSSCRSARPARS
jgi:hypothetical protein